MALSPSFIGSQDAWSCLFCMLSTKARTSLSEASTAKCRYPRAPYVRNGLPLAMPELPFQTSSANRWRALLSWKYPYWTTGTQMWTMTCWIPCHPVEHAMSGSWRSERRILVFMWWPFKIYPWTLSTNVSSARKWDCSFRWPKRTRDILGWCIAVESWT